MGLDVATMATHLLPRPSGVARDFAFALVEDCAAWGEGHALNFYFRTELELLAADYIIEHLLDVDQSKAVFGWVESLPYDEAGYITLYFNW